MNNKVAKIITERIIEMLQQGNIPWKKPWKGSMPMNFKSKTEYKGINFWLLYEQGTTPYWLTLKQIRELKGRLKKGSKSRMVIFWKQLTIKEENDDGEEVEKHIPMLRYYRVFNLDQTEGIEMPASEEGKENKPIPSCQEFIEGLNEQPKIVPGQMAAYDPLLDHIIMPDIKIFDDSNHYYATLFHEIGHWTGNAKRMNRPGIVKSNKVFGDQDYSKEELVAEMFSALCCNTCQIDNSDVFKNTAGYIQHWIKALKDDSTLIIEASSKAQKAYDYVRTPKNSEITNKKN